MTDNINFTSFKAFVMAQDESRKIDHNLWSDCSIGDYLCSTGCALPEHRWDRGWDRLAEYICGDYTVLYDKLNSANTDTMPTYKELQLLLAGYGGDV